MNTHLQHIHKQSLTIIMLYQRKKINNTFGLLMPCYLQEKRTKTLPSQSQLQYLCLTNIPCHVALLVVSRLHLLVTMGKKAKYQYIGQTMEQKLQATKKYNNETDCSLSNSHRHSANANMIADVKSKIIVSRQHFFFADMIFWHFKSSKLSK